MAGKRWIGAWATAMQGPYPIGTLTTAGVSPATPFLTNEVDDQSLRMVIHPTVGGERVRACFSNLLGDRPLEISAATVATSVGTGPAVMPGSAVALSFGGKPAVSVPKGEKRCSDGADFSFAFNDDIAVSFHVPGPSGPITWHSEAYSAQFVSAPGTGNVTTDETGSMFTLPARSFFYLSDFEVEAPASGGSTITAFGDSITDGSFGTPLLNHRYPDFLARRLDAAGIKAGVRNLGINGNRVLVAEDNPVDGPPGVRRFGYEGLEAGTKGVFVLLGTNDIGGDGASAEAVYAGYVELARQAHAAGACIVISTVLPRNDPPLPFGWDVAVDEPKRKALNAMLLASTEFDAVADVAAAMANPLLPDQPFQPYFVEGLHPNSVGMQVLANAIPLEPLLPPPVGRCTR
ncbi:MAG: GDSL-type esterase/lipase family protein [Pseudomonadota bacterium]